MKCPRCQSTIASAPDPSGSLVCPSCGARLRSKNAVAAPAPAPAARSRVGTETVMVAGGARARTPAAAVLENPNATLPPGTPLREIPRPGTPSALEAEADAAPPKRVATPAPPASEPGAPAPPASTVTLEAVLEEVRALRRTQDEILSLLRERPAPQQAPASEFDDPFGFPGGDDDRSIDTPMSVPAVGPLRSRRRKTVLLVDDDAATRQAAVAAFEKAEVPVRAIGDGNGALSALAEEKSDVLVLELGMGGAMGGKDVVNLIKATMEWVDIPIVLYTRLPVAGQKEARQIHGADEIVPKAPGSEEALVARVIQLFRRG
jgi:CheY-like chemotaxis protein